MLYRAPSLPLLASHGGLVPGCNVKESSSTLECLNQHVQYIAVCHLTYKHVLCKHMLTCKHVVCLVNMCGNTDELHCFIRQAYFTRHPYHTVSIHTTNNLRDNLIPYNSFITICRTVSLQFRGQLLLHFLFQQGFLHFLRMHSRI